MIAHLAGQVAEKTETAIIVDVQGIGYEVHVAESEREMVHFGQSIKLYTYYHVRETAHELFGFSSLSAKRLFELLISVSGVGPKMALNVLNLGEVESIRSAIARADVSFIQKANGVGKRLAERISVDLKDKVGLPGSLPSSLAQAAMSADDALDALLALGYSLQQANQALTGVDSSLPTEARLKEALKHL